MLRIACVVMIWFGLAPISRAQDDRQRQQLKVITYNVQFLPSIAAMANKRLLPDYRAATIGKALTEYDIIGLNELFADEPRELLLAKMREAWGDSLEVHLSPKVDKNRFPGGLAIISRLPFLETNTHTYSQFSKPEQFGIYADGFVTKGALHARIATGKDRAEDRSIDLFITHMEARDPKVRPSQYVEFSDFVNQHSSPNRPAILMGDFNTLGDKSQLDDLSSAYHVLAGKLRDAQPQSNFSDLWIEHGQGPGGTSEQVREDGGRRIDYIFMLNPPKTNSFRLETQKISINRFLDSKVIALSDHSAVEATLKLLNGF